MIPSLPIWFENRMNNDSYTSKVGDFVGERTIWDRRGGERRDVGGALTLRRKNY